MTGSDLKRQIGNVRRDIERLRELLESNRSRQDTSWPTTDEIRETLDHTGWCLRELEQLERELRRLMELAQRGEH